MNINVNAQPLPLNPVTVVTSGGLALPLLILPFTSVRNSCLQTNAFRYKLLPLFPLFPIYNHCTDPVEVLIYLLVYYTSKGTKYSEPVNMTKGLNKYHLKGKKHFYKPTTLQISCVIPRAEVYNYTYKLRTNRIIVLNLHILKLYNNCTLRCGMFVITWESWPP